MCSPIALCRGDFVGRMNSRYIIFCGVVLVFMLVLENGDWVGAYKAVEIVKCFDVI